MSRQMLDMFDAARMGGGTHFAAIGLQGFVFNREKGTDVHEHIRREGFLLRGGPFGAGKHFEAIDLPHGAARLGTTGGHDGLVGDAMVDIEIAMVMGVDHLGREDLNDGFKGLHHVQQGQTVHPVVGQAQIFHPL